MSSKTRTRKTGATSSTSPSQTLRSVPDPESAVKVSTDTEDKLWEALHAHPNTTAADLSVAANIGKSTAQKILVRWAGDGSVTRTAGIAQGGRRAADRWVITEVDGAPADTADSTEPTDTVPSDTAADDVSGTTDTGVTDSTDAESVVAAVTTSAHDSAISGGGDTATAGGGQKATRLASGALRGMVEDFLREHPGDQFSPNQIGQQLKRSSGAVNNALEKLVSDGYALRTQEKPKRFQFRDPADTSGQ
jgi:predicted transcriptional regulator